MDEFYQDINFGGRYWQGRRYSTDQERLKIEELPQKIGQEVSLKKVFEQLR
jgi:hypothetical protein